MIEVKEKKNFIEWFLINHPLKKRESVWILNYLIRNSQILEKTHFVEHAKYSTRGMVVSAKSSDDHAFKYYRGHEIVKDAEKAFYDIKRNRDEELYIQLNFKDSHKSIKYLGVLEENPFIPMDKFITNEDVETVEKLLNRSVYQYQIDTINGKIDEALDTRDEEMFYELCKQLNKVKVGF